MLSSSPLHGSDTFIMGAPLLVFLALGLLRLDTLFAASRTARPLRRRVQPIALKDDSAMQTDPDGRRWDQN